MDNKKWSGCLTEFFNSSWSIRFVSLVFNLHLEFSNLFTYWKVSKTNLEELGERDRSVLFNDDDRTKLDDICGHGHVNVVDVLLSKGFIFDGEQFDIVCVWCSGEQRVDDGGEERRT